MNFIRTQIERITNWLDNLTDSQRRLVWAITLITASLIFGALIYWVFFRPFAQTPSTDIGVNDGGIDISQLPEIVGNANREGVENANEPVVLPSIDTTALGGATLSQVIYNDEAQDLVLSGDGTTAKFYDPVTGKFYQINANGELVELSDKKFPGVEEVNWSNGTNKAVLELADGFNILYDFTTDQQYTLHEDMDEFDFSPNDNQISFKFLADNPEDRWLGISQTDGSGAIGVEPLGNYADTVNAQWSPSGQAVGTVEEFVSGQAKQVVPIGFHGENLKGFTVDGRGFDYTWSPDGRQMLYSAYSPANEYQDILYIVDSYGDQIGDNKTNLELNTSVDKCTFAAGGNNVYCAVPVDPPFGAGITPEVLANVPHDIYKIDLNQGTKVKIASPADSVSGTNLNAPSQILVSDTEDVLYYTESDTGRIRRVLLK